MNLIDALAAGVRGAENGTATLLRRGTGTAATWYTDFEGTQSQASGDDLDLDENGAVVAYVNELVTVSVKDTDGTVVREFVAGVAAPAVEYQGQSFTGTDYVTAENAASKPTQLQHVLDLWKDNAGAIDWKVLIGSTATSLRNAFGPLTGLVFNVKDPTYGAVGDGLTNDTSAVTAALTAANASGGLVFFPPGTYRATSALTLGTNTSIAGCGPEVTILQIDHASANLFTVSGGGSVYRSIEGMQLSAAQDNTGTVLALSSGAKLQVRNCQIGSLTYKNKGDLITAANSATTQFDFSGCFLTAGGTNGAFNGAGVVLRGAFVDCNFTSPAAAYSPSNGVVYGRQLDLVRCRFTDQATSGTYSVYKSNSTTLAARVEDCRFVAGGSATVTAIELGTYTSSSVFFERGNDFLGHTAYSYTCGAASLGAQVALVTRETRKYTVTDNTTNPLALPVSQYGMINLIRTNNTAQVIGMDKSCPEGARLTLTITNNSGGTVASGWTFAAGSGDNVFIPGTLASLANNLTSVSEMRGRVSQGAMLVATLTGQLQSL